LADEFRVNNRLLIDKLLQAGEIQPAVFLAADLR
jgi:hypothetical protein